jgi:hypothetical protein
LDMQQPDLNPFRQQARAASPAPSSASIDGFSWFTGEFGDFEDPDFLPPPPPELLEPLRVLSIHSAPAVAAPVMAREPQTSVALLPYPPNRPAAWFAAVEDKGVRDPGLAVVVGGSGGGRRIRWWPLQTGPRTLRRCPPSREAVVWRHCQCGREEEKVWRPQGRRQAPPLEEAGHLLLAPHLREGGPEVRVALRLAVGKLGGGLCGPPEAAPWSRPFQHCPSPCPRPPSQGGQRRPHLRRGRRSWGPCSSEEMREDGS